MSADLSPWAQVAAGLGAAGATLVAAARLIVAWRRHRPQSDVNLGFKLRDELREDAQRLRAQLAQKEDELEHWRAVAEKQADQLTVVSVDRELAQRQRDAAHRKVVALELEVTKLQRQLDECLARRPRRSDPHSGA